MAHSTKTAQLNYGRLITESPNEINTIRERYLRLSEFWHGFNALPSTIGPKNAKNTIPIKDNDNPQYFR